MIQDLPVLLLNFNRPDLTEGLIENLRKIQPRHIYASVDGPRADNEKDAIQCQLVYETLQKIDWPCEVKIKRHPQNLGLRKAVRTALSWFFDEVEFGIVLEDDIRFNEDFFSYCDDMRVRYINDERIAAISGNNLIGHLLAPGTLPEHEFLCTIFHCWGWATWRDRWQTYDDNVVLDNDFFGEPLAELVGNANALNFWRQARLAMAIDQISSWAWRMQFSQWRAKRYFITPPENLCVNVGFSSEATNTKNVPIWSVGLKVNHFKLNRPIPLPIQVNDQFDWYENKALFGMPAATA